MAHLDQRARRALVLRAGVRVFMSTAALFTLYYLLPLDGVKGVGAVIYLILGSIGYSVVLAWQVRKIVDADYPMLRAFEALGVAIPLLITVFAALYFTIAQSNPDHFSEVLNRSGALYFTITVLATVGFGDIVPKTDFARLLVAAQMMINLLLLGTVVRLLMGAAQTGLQRKEESPADAE